MKFSLTPERLRRLRGVGLRVLFGLAVFVIAFYLSFPYHRIKEQVIALAAMRNLDVQIGSAGPVLGVGIAFHDIAVASTPPPGGGRPTKLKIDSARVSIAPLARLSGENAYSLSADALGGEIDIDWQGSKTKSAIKVKTEDLAMAQLPGVREAINLPLAGKLGLTMDLALPTNRTGETNGTISWTCAGCEIGDGKAKLKVAGNPMLAEGLSLPRIRLGNLTGRVVFDKGVGRLQGVQARSPDGELSLEGEIRLADPINYSQLDLYLRFKFSDALLKSAEKLQLLLQLIESMGKRPDGFYGVRLTGTFARVSPPQFSKNSPFGSGAGAMPAPHVSNRPRMGARPTQPSYVPPTPAPQQVDPGRDPNANMPRYPSEPPPPPPTPPPTSNETPVPNAAAQPNPQQVEAGAEPAPSPE
jgi:type II secretion system protein N